MCIIIVGKPEDISKEILLKAYNGNKDGFGLMYAKNNKIISEKFLPKKFKSVLKCFNKHAKNTNEIALHFRYATHGEKNNFNSHPFCILNKKLGDDFDLYLMHNSPLLPAPILDTKKSDTYFFSRYILKPIIKNKTDLLTNESFLSCLNKIINAETNSKVLLLNTFDNKFQYIGEWHDFKNLKVSQKYSIEDYETTTYSRYSNYDDYDFKSYNSNDYYSFDNNHKISTYYDTPSEQRKQLIKRALKIKNKHRKEKYLIDFKSLSHVFSYGNTNEIFKVIKKLNHKQIASLIEDCRDQRDYFYDEEEDDTIQVNDLGYKY